MKNTHRCPKCNGVNIMIFDGYVGAYGSGPHLMAGATTLSAVRKDNYVCCDCGYTEEWIPLEDIPKVQKSKKFHR